MPAIAVGCDEEEDEEAEEKVAPDLRIVFLDIDGVLNTRPDPRMMLLEGGPCAMLRRLLQASGAQVVLATPWRGHAAYVCEALANFGVFGEPEEGAASVEPPRLECTPQHGDGSRRDLEILHWLRARRGKVLAWVALDASDLITQNSANRFEGHLVRPASGQCLGPDDVRAALEHLGCPVDALGMEGLLPPRSLGAFSTQQQPFATAARVGGGGCGVRGHLHGAIPLAASASAALVPASAACSVALNASGDSLRLREAFAWDDALASKMQAVLGALSGSASASSERAAVAATAADAAALDAVPSEAAGAGASAVAPPGSVAACWNTDLGSRMESLLISLGTGSNFLEVESDEPGVVTVASPPRSAEESRAEFDEVLATIRSRFQSS